MIPKNFGGILTHKNIKVYLILSLLLYHLFTFHYSDKVGLDLRLIPFIIGSLYFRMSPILIFIIILVQIPYGINFNLYFVTVLYSLLGLLFWFINPLFLKMAPYKRVLVATLSTYLIYFVSLEIFNSFFAYNLKTELWFAVICLPSIGVALISYIIELFEKNSDSQDELIRVVKLETIEQMSTAISHDIRNPLTTAIGYVELLGNPSLPADKRDNYLTILMEELASAERVTKSFLTFSKPSVDLQEELDIQKELNLIISLLEPLSNFHSVKVISEMHNSTKIMGNKSNFHQCVINILKYMIESSSKNNLIEINTSETKKNAVILIKDTTKILTKKQVQLMDEFYTSTISNKPNPSLNIMVAKSIIQSMTGKILIKSTPKLGTVIQMSFPLPAQKLKKNTKL